MEAAVDTHVSEATAVRMAVAEVWAIDGSRTRLRDVWNAGPTVLVFVRHYGCIFCHELVDEALSAAPEIKRRGGRLVLIGSGSVAQAQRFADKKCLERLGVQLFTDPALGSFDAAEFARGFNETFMSGSSKRAYARARSGGYRITGWLGSLTQLGGVAIVRPPAQITYLFRSRFAGDHPNMDEVAKRLAQS